MNKSRLEKITYEIAIQVTDTKSQKLHDFNRMVA